MNYFKHDKCKWYKILNKKFIDRSNTTLNSKTPLKTTLNLYFLYLQTQIKYTKIVYLPKDNDFYPF